MNAKESTKFWKDAANNNLDLANSYMRQVEMLRDALKEIADPIAAFQRKAKAQNLQANGSMAVKLSNDPGYLKEIARTALNTTIR